MAGLLYFKSYFFPFFTPFLAALAASLTNFAAKRFLVLREREVLFLISCAALFAILFFIIN
jgi:hypothetical protein